MTKISSPPRRKPGSSQATLTNPMLYYETSDPGFRRGGVLGDLVKEILRTENIGELVSAQAMLEKEDIEYFILDEIPDITLGFSRPSRVMVMEADVPRARAVLNKAGFPLSHVKLESIQTTLLNGRVELLQPKSGYHASIDAVFLAAAVPVKSGAQILDVGCGVGSAGLCVLARTRNIHLTGIDIQPALVDLAQQNAALNEVEELCRFIQGDLLTESEIAENLFSVVLMNPPYQEGGTHTPSPRENKALSHGEEASGAKLLDWVRYAHRKLKNGGTLVMIHRADRMDDVIMALEGRRWFGSLEVFPLWPRAGEPAKRVIIRARKERYAPMVLKAGLVVHEKDGQYTNGAQKILRAGEAIADV